MSRVLLIVMISFALCITACDQTVNNTGDPASSIKDSTKFTTIKWQDSAIDFGTKKMGEVVNITFRCTNTGNKALYLYDIRPGCGCTLVDYTKQAIKPGEQGQVDAKFDTNKSHPGTVHKNVYVHSNTLNNTGYLSFSGTITAADSSAHKN